MTAKRKITDKNGVQVFPVTHTKAVLDDNGNSVEQRLQEQMGVINQKQLEVGAVPSDVTPTAGSTNWVTSGGVFDEFYKDRTEGKELMFTAGMNKQKLIISNSKFVTGTSDFNIVTFLPCVKGEPFVLTYQATSEGVSASQTVLVRYSAEVPAVGVACPSIYSSVTIADTDEHSVVCVAPDDGYICIRWNSKTSSSGLYFSSIGFHKWYDVNATNDYVYKGIITTSYSSNKSKYIDANVDSQTFGEVVAFPSTNNNFGVSELLDVEGLSYISIYNICSSSTFVYNKQAGSVFYDSENQPISPACYMQYAPYSYNSIIVKVPSNAKYLRIFAYIGSSTYLDIQSSIVAWTNEKLNTKLIVDESPTENSTNLVESGGVYNELSNQLLTIKATIGGEILSSSDRTAETNESFSTANPSIYDVGDITNPSYYKVAYLKKQYSKGTIVTFYGITSSTSLSVSTGFSSVDPEVYVETNGSLIGLELQNIYVYHTAAEHKFDVVFPFDGWLFIRYFSTGSSWSTFRFTVFDAEAISALRTLTPKVATLESKAYGKKKLVFSNLAENSNGKSGMLDNYDGKPTIIGTVDNKAHPKANVSETYMERLDDLGLKVGDIIEIKATEDYDAVFCFGISWGGSITPTNENSRVIVPEGESLHYVAPNTSAQYIIPEETVYIFVQKEAGRFVYGEKVLATVMPEISFVMGFKDYIDTHPEDGGILTLHPDSEMLPRFMAAQKKVRHDAVYSSPAVIFGHISDCHGADTSLTTSTSATTWKRFIDFCNHWKNKGYIADMIDTGDIVENHMINKRSNVNNTTQVSIGWRVDADNVLTVVGNHDTASAIKDGQGNNTYNWIDNIGILSYNKYIAPNISNWNVTQPEDAAENGWCFYYKDYTTPQGYNTNNGASDDTTVKTAKTLRVIYVDVMGWGYTRDGNNDLVSDDTQKEWVEERLVEAANAGYCVAIAAHYMPMRKKRIECSYTSLGSGELVGGDPLYNTKSRELMLLVAKFQRGTLDGINNDTYGTFMGYITGHRHYDAISKAGGIWDFTSKTAVSSMVDGHECVDFDNERYPQIEFSVGAGYVKLDELYDYTRISGTITNDNFQIIAFQMYNNNVRLIKIGCNIDLFMRKKDMADIYCGSIKEFDPQKTNFTDSTQENYSSTLVTKDGIIYRILNPVIVNGQTSWELSDKVRASRVMSEYVTR